MNEDLARPGVRSAARALGACLLFGCVLWLSACATDPSEPEQQAKQFRVPEGQSAVYVYRSAQLGGRKLLFEVTLDGRTIGTLGTGEFVVGTVPPGTHELRVRAGGSEPVAPATLTLETRGGRPSFAETTFTVGIQAESRIQLTETSAAEGTAVVPLLQLAPGERELGEDTERALAGAAPGAPARPADVADGALVEYVTRLEDGALWEPAVDPDRGVVARVNKSHPLYASMAGGDPEEPTVQEVLELLFFTLARAEWQVLYETEADRARARSILERYRRRVGARLSESVRARPE